MKLAVITCYFDPDYVRARSLRAAIKTIPGVKMLVVKNTRHLGLLRYHEVFWKLWRLRRDEHPDAYFLTFRGQEMLPLVLLLAGKKPVIFDEFIVPAAYARAEKHHRSMAIVVKHMLARASEPLYRIWLARCATILADTQAHAELSARTSNMNLRKYVPIPVGTDEKLFTPGSAIPHDNFEVFYYGNMLPLHGLTTILAAAEQLKDSTTITFRIVGGKRDMQQAVTAAIANGARITYSKWLTFDEIPQAMRDANLCLGGHFGNTQQANHTIPGKVYQILACQVPVLVGASQAMDEYFIDKQNALVVPQADTGALVKAITWASGHPSELKTIAGNGRKLFDKEFSTSAIARRLQPVVDAVS